MDETREKQFFGAIQDWHLKSYKYAGAAEDCRFKHAEIYVNSQQKTDTAKKAEADIATSQLRMIRDNAEIDRDAAYHTMIFFRGSAGEKAGDF